MYSFLKTFCFDLVFSTVHCLRLKYKRYNSVGLQHVLEWLQ